MSIIDRIRRIAQANIHSLLDRADTPEMELTEKISELEKTIEEARDALAGFAVSFKKMQREDVQLRSVEKEWHNRAKDALGAGDEAGARRALGERIQAADRLKKLGPVLEQNRETYDELKRNLAALNDQLQAAGRRLAELRIRRRAAEAQKAFGATLGKASAMAEGDAGFERMEDAVLEAEAQAEIDLELRSGTVMPGDLAKRTHELTVDAELEALKKELDPPS